MFGGLLACMAREQSHHNMGYILIVKSRRAHSEMQIAAARLKTMRRGGLATMRARQRTIMRTMFPAICHENLPSSDLDAAAEHLMYDTTLGPHSAAAKQGRSTLRGATFAETSS